MTNLARRDWVPFVSESLVQSVADSTASSRPGEIRSRIDSLIAENIEIHEQACLNLNPGTNVMNPAAEAALGSGLGSRPSLGYPGDKYEMGLEAIEQIEVIAAELAAEVFRARFAEVRVASGAMANMYAFMACLNPGDAIIVPPASIGGHVTHHESGVAGLYGLDIHRAPIDPARYTIDVDGLRELAHRVQPAMITVGSSLNLFHHPVREIREIADEVGAKVLFDAAHLSGVIAGGAWPDPLAAGAHVMTMSTYKSLGGPPSGLLVTNDADLAERVDAIAYPGLTANFDAAKSAALAITLLDWVSFGGHYASEMTDAARALALALHDAGVPVFAIEDGATQSHAFAIDARTYCGGHNAAKRLRQANLLSCGIGLPLECPDGVMAGLRLGLNEAVRWGMHPEHMPELARLIERALHDDDRKAVAKDVTSLRSNFTKLHYIH